MREKKIQRYSNVELLYVIKNSKDNSKVLRAKSELSTRNLKDQELEQVEEQYKLFLEQKEKRENELLAWDEWIIYFLLPVGFNHRMGPSKDHIDMESERFKKYGFNKKLWQMTTARMFGVIFYIIILFIIIFSR
ncbi:hypothetical protein GWK08_16365 [Leptobacterium flavescens]|uniref:Uncharacterized protein n=1 Tax=Leptobacterium flavescens TaxID=472055 RepID=A0A6P0UNS4_9FLAO|nr:hypothetical protein [Leptobacterium flavescens]NER15031.1 hypothetical protein [Leptobacterium flavescens]